MADGSNTPSKSPSARRWSLRPRFGDHARLLRIAAWGVIGLAVLAIGLLAASRLWRDEPLNLAFAARNTIFLVIAAGLAAVLFGLAAVLRASSALHTCVGELERLHVELRAQRQGSHNGDSAAEPPSGDLVRGPSNDPSFTALLDELSALLRDTRENTLLTDEQRRQKVARLEQEEFAEALAFVDRVIADGDFPRARQRYSELSRKYPGRPALATLSERIERSQAAREHTDHADYSRRVDELMTISAWSRAQETAGELCRRYPQSQKAEQLLQRVERELGIYEESQRTRMYAEVHRLIGRKRWREAFAAALTFMERFPNRPEADAVRVQLDTLKNNADIAARAELEAEITELAKRGQYAEAETLARKVIAEYPDSPTAEILRSQLDRLHELATNPKAPPPRVRPSGIASSSGLLPLK